MTTSTDDVPDAILPFSPAPGAVVGETPLPKLGGVALTLSNGLRVVLQERDFLDDELLITGLAVGGLSELPPSLLGVGRMAHLLAGELGVYGHRPQVLNDILAGKRIDLSVSASAYSRAFKGSASPGDAAELMQLVHALFTCRIDVVEEELQTALHQAPPAAS
ncbi:hypothetical protein MNEG_16276 [Monoraphidium neglectum]|uniref:Uncharacterized protein n=1 Tax=Monoraphidium neglectum TaxID=145388 RepID=A0A0D2K6B1_9CHLO|nr:hypothetical protein MNEG_16276 [Monoraphidium neglectum]KIY91688.1 hypothetical protein MNEG_16276 [Monoraphidium neglectum]|eukprot:XP_013890708.1 hypothetical protein MNEG_16276 [Monoraphidium neglectum]